MKDFDFLVKKIQADYPGYRDKVTGTNLARLKNLEKEIRQKIAKHPDSCEHYLTEYTNWFKDYHLRVNRKRKESNPRHTIMEVSTYGKNLNVNVDSLQHATKNSTGIEAVWKGFRHEFLVVKDGLKYVGVVVNNQGWKNGQILFEFIPVNDTVFDVINYSLVKDRKTYMTKASLHLDGKVLEFHNDTKFVRKSGADILDKAILYSYVPTRPNGRNTYPVAMYLSDSTFYMRIPDFYSNTANQFVIQHWDEIVKRPNLIIDIRYNGGGQDGYYQEFAKLIYTKPYESKGVEWYASKGNIRFFEDAMKKGEIRNGEAGMKWTRDLVNAMKKNV